VTRPRASVVIASRNSDDVIEGQLARLAVQDGPDFEVVVADNGLSPRLPAIAARWRSDLDIRVVDATARIGCGPARNVGVAAARADRLLFCDAGDHVATTWVADHLDALERFDFATGPKALVSPARIASTPVDELFEVLEFSQGPNTMGGRPFASGGNAAYRREVLDRIGGFCSHNLRREDVEASWLAQDRGFALGFGAARLIYVTRAGWRQRWWQSFGYGVGQEALRRQMDPGGEWISTLGTTAKLGLARSVRRPGQAVAASGSIAGQVSERLLPGRYFETARRRAGQVDV
jgi:glycosyltransferase involved in cell wall biosynthesis